MYGSAVRTFAKLGGGSSCCMQCSAESNIDSVRCRTWQTILAATGGAESILEVWAPTTKHQLHGVTRANVLRLCAAHGIACVEKDFSLTSVYSAEEAFVTGTFAGLIPVTQVQLRLLFLSKYHLREAVLAACRLLHSQVRMANPKQGEPGVRNVIAVHHNGLAVMQIDGRTIGSGVRGRICSRLQHLYTEAMDAQADGGRLSLDDV